MSIKFTHIDKLFFYKSREEETRVVINKTTLTSLYDYIVNDLTTHPRIGCEYALPVDLANDKIVVACLFSKIPDTNAIQSVLSSYTEKMYASFPAHQEFLSAHYSRDQYRVPCTVKASNIETIPDLDSKWLSTKCSQTLTAHMRYKITHTEYTEYTENKKENNERLKLLNRVSPPYVFGLREWIQTQIGIDPESVQIAFDQRVPKVGRGRLSTDGQQSETIVVVRVTSALRDLEEQQQATDVLRELGELLINSDINQNKVYYRLDPTHGAPSHYRIGKTEGKCKNASTERKVGTDKERQIIILDDTMPEKSTGGARRATVTLPSTASAGVRRGDAKSWPQPKGGKVRVASVRNGGRTADVEFTSGAAVTPGYLDRLKRSIRATTGASRVRFER